MTLGIAKGFPEGFPHAIRQLLASPLPPVLTRENYLEDLMFQSILLHRASVELAELSLLLRWHRSLLVGALATSTFVREALAARGETWESLTEELMGEDRNDVVDPEGNNNTD